MQNMIKKVVEMDEKARELEAQAQQEKVSIKEQIELQRKKVHDEYVEQARIRAKKNDQMAQEKAEKQLEESVKKHQEALSKLKEQFNLNCDAWVEEIVKRVIEYAHFVILIMGGVCNGFKQHQQRCVCKG
ncbi:MAG: hypothetical protein SOZ45_03270 [Ruminococcus sp.]|nr:hypothetical protein [Ruminococcus sp.]